MTSTMDTKKMFEYCRIPMDQLENHPDARAKIKIFKEKPDVYKFVGQMMYDEVVANNAAGKPTRWVLPAGPDEQFPYFIDLVNKNRTSLKDLHVFLMDATLDWNCRPYPAGHPLYDTYGKFTKKFYDKIDPELTVPVSQRYFPQYDDLDAIDIAVERLGGLDTVYGGLGFRGLVAFCEAPLSPWYTVTKEDYLNMKTRIFPINPDTMIAYAQRNWGGLTHVMPSMGISIGFKSMATAKKVVFVSTTGSWKRTAVRVLLFNEPTVEYPATLFTEKSDVWIVCDESTAASPLPEE